MMWLWETNWKGQINCQQTHVKLSCIKHRIKPGYTIDTFPTEGF